MRGSTLFRIALTPSAALSIAVSLSACVSYRLLDFEPTALPGKQIAKVVVVVPAASGEGFHHWVQERVVPDLAGTGIFRFVSVEEAESSKFINVFPHLPTDDCAPETKASALTLGLIPWIGCKQFGWPLSMTIPGVQNPVQVDPTARVQVVSGWFVAPLNLLPSRAAELSDSDLHELRSGLLRQLLLEVLPSRLFEPPQIRCDDLQRLETINGILPMPQGDPLEFKDGMSCTTYPQAGSVSGGRPPPCEFQYTIKKDVTVIPEENTRLRVVVIDVDHLGGSPAANRRLAIGYACEGGSLTIPFHRSVSGDLADASGAHLLFIVAEGRRGACRSGAKAFRFEWNSKARTYDLAQTFCEESGKIGR